MGFEDSDAVADEGVAAVNRLFSRDLKWIFREVPKRDVGVDAQVEVCRDRIVTSRLLALQIKAGESHFNESAKDGWTYRGDPDHLKCYLADSLPYSRSCTIRGTERPWWQHVSNKTIDERTKAGRYSYRGISNWANRPELL